MINHDNRLMTKRVGIFGGTFDPVHLGHIHAARAVAHEFSLDHIYLVPAHQPVHRDNPGATSEQRMQMINLAIADDESLLVDGRELQRGGPSYSLLTVQEYREEYPADQLFFLLGTDAFNGLTSWYHWQEIFDFVNFIVMGRPDIQLATDVEAASFLNHRLSDRPVSSDQVAGHIFISKKAMLTNSATEVRQAIAANLPLSGLLNKKVASFIKEHNIYRKDLLK